MKIFYPHWCQSRRGADLIAAEPICKEMVQQGSKAPNVDPVAKDPWKNHEKTMVYRVLPMVYMVLLMVYMVLPMVYRVLLMVYMVLPMVYRVLMGFGPTNMGMSLTNDGWLVDIVTYTTGFIGDHDKP